MIAVDTSAIMAILLGEARRQACIDALLSENHLIMSAGTFAETLIVAGRRSLGEGASGLVERFRLEIISITPRHSKRVAEAYSIWGKGVHPARLNLGDCFAYALAKEHGCPLLYVGNDFALTDIQSVL
jgi:ribonuclease VapC